MIYLAMLSLKCDYNFNAAQLFDLVVFLFPFIAIKTEASFLKYIKMCLSFIMQTIFDQK